MNPLRIARAALLAAVAGGVAAAAWFVHGAQQEPPPPAAALLAQAFPGWPAQAASAVQQLDLHELPDSHKEGRVQAWVQPLHLVTLDERHLALVTRAVRTDARGQPDDCHACGAILGAYFFERQDGGAWRLTARQDGVLETGAAGSLGTTQVHRLEEGQFAVSAEWGSCWQGYCGTWLALVGLRPDHATVLSDGVRLSVDNDSVAGACSALDGRPGVPGAARSHQCLQVHAAWKIDGPRLEIHFTGRLHVKGTHHRMQPVRHIDQQAAYRLSAGSMMLLQGRNPVPAF